MTAAVDHPDKTRRAIPPPLVDDVKNFTGLAHLQFQKMGPGVEFFDVLAVKGTWRIDGDRLVLADRQRPVEPADRYWNEADVERSSLRIAGDAVVTKPRTDVYVTGTARLGYGERRQQWTAGLRLLEGRRIVVEQALTLTGPRAWAHSRMAGWNLGDAVPTDAVELRYENAFGGSHARTDRDGRVEWLAHASNPCGTGFVDLDHVDKSKPLRAPQIEWPGQPVQSLNQRYPLAGLGPLPRFWPARTRYGGKHDARWREQFDRSVVPDYPDDFDPRFFQAAPASQTCPHLEGTESLVLVNLLAHSGLVTLNLPGLGIVAVTRDAINEEGTLLPKLDTVHVDLDTREVMLTWRFTLPRSAGIHALQIYSAPLSRVPDFKPRGT